eukprot:365194-Chlamydomonas_euryale.AAC.7
MRKGKKLGKEGREGKEGVPSTWRQKESKQGRKVKVQEDKERKVSRAPWCIMKQNKERKLGNTRTTKSKERGQRRRKVEVLNLFSRGWLKPHAPSSKAEAQATTNRQKGGIVGAAKVELVGMVGRSCKSRAAMKQVDKR